MSDEIPVIDISGLSGGSMKAVEAVADGIAKACRTVGFFYISNHGVPLALQKDIFEATKRFHSLPLEEKMKIKRNAGHRGYSPIAASKTILSSRFEPAKTANQREIFNIRHEVDESAPDYDPTVKLQGPNQWPEDAWFKNIVSSYNAEMLRLGMSLLAPVSVALGKEPDFLEKFFAPPTTNLVLIHYPPAPQVQDGAFGINPHTDYGFLTILAQDDVGGLEVQGLSDEWIDATPIPNTFVINIGDVLQRWTNDQFRSNAHKVINRNPTRDRYSVGFFFDPNMKTEVNPLQDVGGVSSSKSYESFVFGDYFANRLDTNYPLAGLKKETA